MSATTKEPKRDRPDKRGRTTLFMEIDTPLKKRLVRLAGLPTRRRTIKAELVISLERYLDQEEAKEGITA